MVVEVGTMMVIQIGTGAMAAAAVGGEMVGGEIRNPRILTTTRIDIISEAGGGSSNQLFSKKPPYQNTWKNKKKCMTLQLVTVIFQHVDLIYFE